MEKANIVPACDMKNIVPKTTDQFWNALRHKGTGPKYLKIGRKVYYRLSDVQEWLDGNVYTRPDRPVSA
jgi:hypothetical protein